MPPTQDAYQRVLDFQTAFAKSETEKDREDAKANDDARKARMKKLTVEAYEKAGYDMDATLKDFATRVRDGNLTQDQAVMVQGLLGNNVDDVADYARWGFITEETKNLVISALKK